MLRKYPDSALSPKHDDISEAMETRWVMIYLSTVTLAVDKS